MADTKISALSDLGATPAAGDYVEILDVSDTTMGSSGTNKRVAYSNLVSGGGDVSSNTSSSVDSEIALFSGTGGKTIKRASTTGIPKLTSGVISAAAAGTDYTSPTGTESLTNKTITDSTNNVMAKSLKSATTTVDVSAATAPTSGQVLTATSGTAATWQTPSGGVSTTTAKARAYRNTSTQTINNASFTKVQLNAESYDPGSNFDSATNYRFTVPTTGYYAVTGVVLYNSTTTDKRYICAVYQNGAEIFENEAHASHANGLSVTTTDYVFLTASDYVELYTYHESGSSTTVANGSQYTYLSIHLLST